MSKTYGFGQATDTTKRERRHKLQEYIRSTVSAFPPEGLPQPLLTFLGLKNNPLPRRAAITATDGGAPSPSAAVGANGGAAAGSAAVTFTPRTDTDGYVLCGGGMARFDALLPTEPNEAMREAIKLGDAMLCTQLLAAKVWLPGLCRLAGSTGLKPWLGAWAR